LSACCALGIALNGADGETRAQIKEAMELSGLSVEQANLAYRELSRLLSAADQQVTFEIANSFWYRQNKAIVLDFVSNCSNYFRAPVEAVDFTQMTTINRINEWVSLNTAGKITEIMTQPRDPTTEAMILSAAYFRGSWTMAFRPENTQKRWFYMADGDSVLCNMMYRDGDEDAQRFRQDARGLLPVDIFFEPGVFLGMNLPFGSGRFVMTIVTPDTTYQNSYYAFCDTNTNLSAVMEIATADNIVKWGRAKNVHQRYWMSLPKFRFSWEEELDEALQALGIEEMFSSRADFSRLFADGLGSVLETGQKTFIAVDEEGAEGAALQRIYFADSLPPEINCNRPFLFIIQERESEAILFIGKIGKPVWEE